MVTENTILGPDGVQSTDGLTAFRNRFEVEKVSELTSSQHTDYLQSNGQFTKLYQNDIVSIGDSGFSPSPWDVGDAIQNVRFYNNIFHIIEQADSLPQYIRTYNNAGLPYYSNVYILNNLFVDLTNANSQGVSIGEELGTVKGSDNVFANNIFVNVGAANSYVWQKIMPDTGDSADASPWTITNNIIYHATVASARINWYGTNYTAAQWKATFDPSTGTNLPSFVSYTAFSAANDFHLLGSDTNALDKGLDYSSIFTTDFDGNTRAGTWDIGPFEYAANPISIDTQPASVSIWPGENATFTVEASGNTPITYQWKINGTDITGATTSSYRTNRVHLTANGNVYTCGVTNPESGELTSEATLTVAMTEQPLPCKYGTVFSVEPRATRAYSVVDTNAGNIFFVWPTNALGNQVVIYRRVWTNNPNYWSSWMAIYTNAEYPMPPGEYVDTTATSGISYEYDLRMDTTNKTCDVTDAKAWMMHEYINTGIEVPLDDTPGNVVLLVENTLASSIGAELTTLTNDLIGAGYKVFRHDVAAVEVEAAGWYTAVTNTKALIAADYNTDTTATWSIFIVGHVPVPYSGDGSPGSHSENTGAHAADWYYADLTDASWTDSTVNDSTATNVWSHTWNIPGDGKFDQTTIPTMPEMRVARIDLRNMTAFSMTEVELIQQYLNRDHQWRHKLFTVRDRALINTNGVPIQGHSQYASLLGAGTNYDLVNWLDIATNAANSYLIASSKGAGLYTSDLTLGTTTNFAQKPLYVPHLSMHGSYYGDWDGGMHANHVMWSTLCNTGLSLTVYYRENDLPMNPSHMGAPVVEDFYAMASNIKSPVGARYLVDCFWHTNGGTITENAQNMNAYCSFGGDPTLTLRVVAPPTNVVATTNAGDVVLSWTAPSETGIQGYHVYRAATGNLNAFTRLTTTVTTSPYTNTGGASAAYTYWVRTVKLEDSPQRSYYNASQGVFAEAGGGEAPAATGNRWTNAVFRGTTIFR